MNCTYAGLDPRDLQTDSFDLSEWDGSDGASIECR